MLGEVFLFLPNDTLWSPISLFQSLSYTELAAAGYVPSLDDHGQVGILHRYTHKYHILGIYIFEHIVKQRTRHLMVPIGIK